MTRKSIIKKLLKAKNALNHIIQKILDINKKRKQSLHLDNDWHAHSEDELRLLNKMAATQARIVQHYERMLNHRG